MNLKTMAGIDLNTKTVAGIDCGWRSGGVGLIGPDQIHGRWAEVHDLPVFEKHGVDVSGLVEILMSCRIDHVYIEAQQAMPKQGASSTFNLGVGYGQILATCALLHLPHTVVRPAVWKKALGIGRDKDAARCFAKRLYPKVSKDLNRKKDEHRAEGLLIAHYGYVYG